jgi:hypothetical protein
MEPLSVKKILELEWETNFKARIQALFGDCEEVSIEQLAEHADIQDVLFMMSIGPENIEILKIIGYFYIRKLKELENYKSQEAVALINDLTYMILLSLNAENSAHCATRIYQLYVESQGYNLIADIDKNDPDFGNKADAVILPFFAKCKKEFLELVA